MAEDAGGGTGGSGLMKRTAGLPMWGWVALAGAAGIVALMWYQRGKAGAAAAAPTLAVDTSSGPNDQNAALLAQIRDLQGANSTATTTPTTYTNNAEWAKAALAWYVKPENKPKFGAQKMYYALQSWMNGGAIWSDEWNEIGRMLVGVGAPPEPVKNGPINYVK